MQHKPKHMDSSNIADDDTRSQAMPAPVAPKISQVVHSASGVRRAIFTMNASHARLARSLAAIDKRQSPAAVAAASATQTISRASVLTTLVAHAHAQGLTASEIGFAILGRSDERAVHRISAHLAREVQRGLVVAHKGRRVKRHLTDKGRAVASQMELASARREKADAAAAEAVAQISNSRVNGVFN